MKAEGLPMTVPAKTKKVFLSPTRRQVENPWHKCCDTRAVAAIVMHLHVERRDLFFAAIDIVDWVIENELDPLQFEASDDIAEAFDGRSRIDIFETVKICLEVLTGNGLLLPEYLDTGSGAVVDVYQVEWEAYHVLFDIFPRLADAVDALGIEVFASAE